MVAAVRRAKSWWKSHPVAGWVVVAGLTVALGAGAFAAWALTVAATPEVRVYTANQATTEDYNVNVVSDYQFRSWTLAAGETISATGENIAITFPDNFDLSAVDQVQCPAGTDVLNYRISGQTVYIDLNAAMAGGTNFRVYVMNVRNPSHPGNLSAPADYTFPWQITTSNGVQTGTFINATVGNGPFTAAATAVTGRSTALTDYNPNTSATYTVGFTTGALGRISGTTAAGPDVINITYSGGGLPASPTTVQLYDAFNGTTVTADATVAGNILTVTMPAGRTIPGNTAVTVALAGVTNPVAGTYNTVVNTTPQTTNSATSNYVIAATHIFVAAAPEVLVYDAGSTTTENYAVNDLGDYRFFSWTTATGETIAAGENIAVTFPDDCDLTTVDVASVRTAATLTCTYRIVGQTIYLTLPSVIAQNTNFSVRIYNVGNPSHPGDLSAPADYTFPWQITTSTGTYSGTLINETAGNGPFTAAATAVTGRTTTLSDNGAGGTATYTVGFTTGALGRISGTTAAGPDVINITYSGGGLPASPTTVQLYDAFNGTTVTADATVAGNILTVTMPAGRTIPGNTAVTVALAGVTNPVAGTYNTVVNTTPQTTNSATSNYVITTITAAQVTIDNGLADPSGVEIAAGQTGILANRFSINRTAGSATAQVTALTVNAGTAAGTAHIWTDADGDGLVEAGDSEIGSGALGSSITLTTSQTVNPVGTPAYYLVMVDVAALAGDGQTVTARISAATGSGTPAPVFTFLDSANTFTVRAATTVELDDGTNDPYADVWPGQTLVAVDQFTLQRTQGSKVSTVNTVTVTKTGTAAISNVYIYTDANHDGSISGEAQIASGTFNVDTAELTISQTVTDTLVSYLVVYDIPGTATDGQWTTAEITAADYSASIDTFTESDNLGFVFWVRDTNVTLGDGANDPAPAGVTPGRTGVAVNQFTLQRTQGAKAASVGTVTVTRPTVAGSIAISNVYIYSDGGTLGVIDGTDAAIASGTFSGATATLTINQTVTDALASYLVVYDIPAGAILGHTTTAEITAAAYTNVDHFTENDNTGSIFTVVADGTAPSDPTPAFDEPGTEPYTIAKVWWTESTDLIGVVGYRIYRATSADPAAAEVVGTSAVVRLVGDPWLDTDGVPGEFYWYWVSAYDAAGNESALVLATPNPVRATWTLVPHDTYTSDTRLCRLCHTPHQAATSTNLFIDAGATLLPGATAPGQAPVCYACHDGSGSKTNVKIGTANAFSLASGHNLEAVDGAAADLTNTCSSCHDPHKDVDSGPMLPAETVNGVTIMGTGNAWCGACHNAAASWYDPADYGLTGTYAARLLEPSRDATGYPTAGTYPGPTVYTSVGSPHGNSAVGEGIPAGTMVDPMILPAENVDRTQGDCLWCHASHRSASAYDGLNAEWRPTTAATLTDDQDNGTYAAVCFTCHDGNADWIAKGAKDIKTAVTAGGPRSGHRIEMAGALYPIGAPLPCYECHNPHGSAASKAGLSVMTMTDGTTRVLLGDQSGEIDVSTPEGVRAFCFSCHTTAGDVSGGNGFSYGWDGSGYTQITDANAKVAGVSRISYDSVNERGLKIPVVNGHYRDDLDSCAKCHGNIHNPSPGLSAGGVPCYECHDDYQSPMEDNVGKIGATNASFYHHVLGGAAGDGDIAPNTGAYPTSATDVYCVSCHTDHNYFNGPPQAGEKGANLRYDITSAIGSLTTNTDFTPTGAPTYGICVGCHSVSRVKQDADLADGPGSTPSIVGADYDASAHDYTVTSDFTGSAFLANCSKCHSDEQDKDFATSTYRFGTHWSSSTGILKALGAFTLNPPKEEACFACHITAAQSTTDQKATALKDAYNAVGGNMSVASEATFAEFAKAGSTHDLTNVACVNCHNVHEASASAPVADPDNTYTPAAWTTTANKNDYCLKCHDGTMPTAVNNPTTFVPYDVQPPAAPAKPNVGTYNASGHGSVAPVVACRTCHEQHGSDLTYLLATPVDGQDIASYEATPNASGLADQAQCLACHRTGGMASTANISQYYSTDASGTAVQGNLVPWDSETTRFGHRIKNGPYAGSAMPCRSCHNPHGGVGSGYMLAVRTQVDASGVDTIIGDAAGELAMSDAAQTPTTQVNVRRFCFTCHTTSDNSQGWNGGTMAVVPAAAEVMGISRTGGVLKLPVLLNGVKGHALADTYSCYLCHGDDFSADNSVNVHNPAAGESRGGIPCYICHTVYQVKMEDGLDSAPVSKMGASRTTSYHHVLGSADHDGDWANGVGAGAWYPNLTTDTAQKVYCLSCHVDHDRFSPLVNAANSRSYNLRAAFSDAAVGVANSDWSATGGVCLGCHTTGQARDNTDQKPETSSTYTPPISSANYDASAHQYPATSTFTDAKTFNGDCVKCHDSETDGGGMERGSGVEGFQTSTNKFSVHYSSNRRILAAMGVAIADPPGEEITCYKCHSLSGQGFKSVANDDWYGASSTLPGGTMTAVSQGIYGLMSSTYKHNVGGYNGLHRPSATDETQAYISANKHVECADCHNVHAATTARHLEGTNLVSGALKGVSGVSATYPAGAAATNFTGPTGYTTLSSVTNTSATAEYQICFKCHSGANTNRAAWDGVAGDNTSSLDWTNVALDFSTNNGSYHPVVAALPTTDPNVAYGSSRLDTGQLINGWVPGEMMYCSDCHASSSAASFGPHGSSVKWMLRGPNQAWPYMTSAANGTSGNTNYITFLRDADGTSTTPGGTNGAFCLNCHALTGTVHGTGQHEGVACVGCHVRVPHGAKTSRLLQVFNNASGTYPYTMPARLTSTGTGTQTTTMRGNIMTHAYKDGWGTGACTMTGGTAESECGGGHGNTQTTTDARW